MKKIFALLTILLTSLVSVNAQQAVSLSTASAAYCPYTFTRDLKTGSTGPDVKILQQILNSDQRTVIAASGMASPGSETESYGVATREAVKKFQALFIEYIGVANGVFGPKTRTVMNAVCNGEYYTSGQGTSYSSVTTQNTVNNNINTAQTSTTTVASDTVPPSIYLRSNSTSINSGLSFRIIVTASEPIQTFTPDSIIIDGGSVSDIRKLSPNSYSLLITPNDSVKSVTAQVEADRILDLAGNKNDNASNEIRISIIQTVATATTSTSTATVTTGVTSSDLDSIFNRILAQVTPATVTQPTTCSNGATNPPYCNNQYSNQPNYNSGYNNNSGQNQQNSLMNMLLLSSLLRGGNSGSGGGLFGNLFGGSSKTSQPSYTGGGTGGSGVGSSGSSSADIQACANGDKTKCTSSTDTPAPPARPTELGGVPTSGEIIKEIDCQKIEQKNGNAENYLKCKPEKDPVRFYLVKDLKNGSNVQYVLSYKGTAKDSKGGIMSDLKPGIKFLEGENNALRKVTDNKNVCKIFNESANPKCTENEDSKGKNMFEFQTEDKAKFDENSKSSNDSNLGIAPPEQPKPVASDDIKQATDPNKDRLLCRSTYELRLQENCTSIFGLTTRCQNISKEATISMLPSCAEISFPW